ncbi:MAG: VOC family protein, partial [Solirubrobacteraceae bacterium]
MQSAIQPELWVQDVAAAVAFYMEGFAAKVEHWVGGPGESDGVAQLSVDGACFWVSGDSDELRRLSPAAIGGTTSRTLLIVHDPVRMSAAATAAGAKIEQEAREEHGWLLARIVDPFGHE